MKLAVLSVFDSAVSQYTSPMIVQSVGLGLRLMGDMINGRLPNTEEVPMRQHPEDFSLWHVGHFDSDSGELIPMSPVIVAQLKDLRLQ